MYINIKNINKARPSVKLDYRNIRPYRMEEVLSPLVYKLKLLILVRI